MSVTLKDFRPAELIFDEKETREILAFFFSSRADIANSMSIDDQVKSFAQALLLEAVDASYTLGFVQALTSSITRPNLTISKLLKKFGKKAAKNWFKHATARDLLNIKIYEIVRRDIEWSFGRVFIMYSNGIAMRSHVKIGFIASRPLLKSNMAWG